jgi:hypothetical protein
VHLSRNKQPIGSEISNPLAISIGPLFKDEIDFEIRTLV